MAYAVGYCAHTWEMNALRGWAVAFLAYVASVTGERNPRIAPTVVATSMGLIGTWASVTGNEVSIRLGRRAARSGGHDRLRRVRRHHCPKTSLNSTELHGAVPPWCHQNRRVVMRGRFHDGGGGGPDRAVAGILASC